MRTKCYHCGLDCEDYSKNLIIDDKNFCCNGCKTVYEILNESGMQEYYNMNKYPGGKVDENISNTYNFLDNIEIKDKLLSFTDGNVSVVEFFVPNVHCSSCIWLLEKISDLDNRFLNVRVNFVKRLVKITYKENEISLKEVVNFISNLGYAPKINLDNLEGRQDDSQDNRAILYKLGVAGFVFGNTMIFALPEYFQLEEYWLDRFKYLFRWIMLILSLPVLFYSAQPYLISAYRGIKNKFLNIDIPISFGILALFLRSSIEVLFNLGSGYFDSFSGLIFFLLLGKFFQRKTYDFLSFERDYKSYFPLAITRINSNKKEEYIELNKIKKGDILLIRNEEIIPSDSILKKGDAYIDNSFVTGESYTIHKNINDKIYAGGKQLGGNIEVEVLNTPSQSYLTQLWNNEVFNKEKYKSFKNSTDVMSKYFTVSILIIAFFSSLFWIFADISKALNVFTSILIIACPCALAISAPFTLGNIIRIFGKNKFFVKNSDVIEKISKIRHIVFDKTGTLTKMDKKSVSFLGKNLSKEQNKILKTIFRVSNHPLSRVIYESIDLDFYLNESDIQEKKGLGIEGFVNGKKVKVGSAIYLNLDTKNHKEYESVVHVEIDDDYLGYFVIKNIYRDGIDKQIKYLSKKYKISILSGDNPSEKKYLEKTYPFIGLFFNKTPQDKLDYIKQLQKKYNVMMIGDGLNDAGALKQSDVGVSLSENINSFTPASDVIMDAENLNNINTFFKVSKKSVNIIYYSFVFSFLYNVVGLSFAISGNLTPVISAILMPLSSISIVFFVTILSRILCYRYRL